MESLLELLHKPFKKPKPITFFVPSRLKTKKSILRPYSGNLKIVAIKKLAGLSFFHVEWSGKLVKLVVKYHTRIQIDGEPGGVGGDE